MITFFSIAIFNVLPSGHCDLCYLTDFIISYGVDGVLFSVIKYCLIYFANDDLIIDPRCLVAYSVCVGSGFSVARLVFLISTKQDLAQDWFPIYYSFDAPLQCLTSMFIGTRLADVRFYGHKHGFLTSVIPVIFFYGTFIFVCSSTIVNEDTLANRTYMITACIFVSLLLCAILRYQNLKYGEIVVSDIQELLALGLIQHPCEFCRNFVCCRHQRESWYSPSRKYDTPPLSPAPIFINTPGITPKKIDMVGGQRFPTGGPDEKTSPLFGSVFGFSSFDDRKSNFMPIPKPNDEERSRTLLKQISNSEGNRLGLRSNGLSL